ncbi:hypothetical protein SRHO_G00069780 [Serrasalmus rhombeus]
MAMAAGDAVIDRQDVVAAMATSDTMEVGKDEGGAMATIGAAVGLSEEAAMPMDDATALGPTAPPVDLCKVCGQRHLLDENHEYNYKEEVDDELLCHICLQPLIRPLDTPCGHTYCQECLTSFLLESDFCPVDRVPLLLQTCRKSSLLVSKLLDKLIIACPFSDFCSDIMPRGELQGHLQSR